MMEKKLIHMSKQQTNFIRKLASETGISFSEMVRRILDEYMKSSKKE